MIQLFLVPQYAFCLIHCWHYSSVNSQEESISQANFRRIFAISSVASELQELYYYIIPMISCLYHIISIIPMISKSTSYPNDIIGMIPRYHRSMISYL